MSANIALASVTREGISRRGAGSRQGKAMAQLSARSSSIAKLGSDSDTTEGMAETGVHIHESTAWSDPNKSAKETDASENWSEMTLAALSRTRSRTEGVWSGQLLTHMTVWGGLTRSKLFASNHSSRGTAQGESVADGRDHM